MQVLLIIIIVFCGVISGVLRDSEDYISTNSTVFYSDPAIVRSVAMTPALIALGMEGIMISLHFLNPSSFNNYYYIFGAMVKSYYSLGHAL